MEKTITKPIHIELIGKGKLNTAVEATLWELGLAGQELDRPPELVAEPTRLVIYCTDQPQDREPGLAETPAQCRLGSPEETAPFWYIRASKVGDYHLALGPTVQLPSQDFLACLGCLDRLVISQIGEIAVSGQAAPAEETSNLDLMSYLVAQQVSRFIEGQLPAVTYPGQFLIFNTLKLKRQLTAASRLPWCQSCLPAEVFPWETFNLALLQRD
jgi:hypothetical protein